MEKTEYGFTLLELLITLTLVGVTLSAIIPGFQALTVDVSRFNTLTTLKSSLSFARSEAITRHRVVRLCASEDGETCSKTKEWEKGWIVYVDLSGESVRTNADPIIRHQSSVKNLTIRKNGREKTVRFDNNGWIGLNRSFYICSAKNKKPLNRLILIQSGRIRTDVKDIRCS